MAHLIQNPLFLRLAALFILLVAAFVIAGWVVRELRRRLVSSEGAEQKSRVPAGDAAFTFAAYEGVIRKLKEQEKELERLRRTEREQANESASMSGAVLTNLGSGVLLFNTANLVRQANPAAKSLLGYQSVFGLHARDIFRGVSQVRLTVPTAASNSDIAESAIDWAADGAQPLLAAVNACIKEATLFRRIEVDYRSPAGESKVLGITLSPIRNAAGESMGAAGLLSDLTEITNLSQQMRLRESMAALGEMSAGIAHEFKNSLATISGYAQMLLKESGTGSSSQFAGKIASETEALARIVNDFLQFAKPQGLQRVPVDLKSLLLDCAEESGVKLLFEDCPSELLVDGDPTALRQTFSNLLRNSAEAVEATTSSQVTVRILDTEGQLTLVLSDNGRGIPADKLPLVFIPFFTTKPQGTGLGLALVHRIVTEHGGTIRVASGPVGTEFTIAFPLRLLGGNPIRTNTKAE